MFQKIRFVMKRQGDIKMYDRSGREPLLFFLFDESLIKKLFLFLAAGKVIAVQKKTVRLKTTADLFVETEFVSGEKMVQGFEGDHGVHAAFSERHAQVIPADQKDGRMPDTELREHSLAEIDPGDTQVRTLQQDRIQFQSASASQIQDIENAFRQIGREPRVRLLPAVHVGRIILKPDVEKSTHFFQRFTFGLFQPPAEGKQRVFDAVADPDVEIVSDHAVLRSSCRYYSIPPPPLRCGANFSTIKHSDKIRKRCCMKKKNLSLIRRFAAYYRPYKARFAMDVLMSTVITVCGLTYPMITRRVINTYVPQHMLPEMIRAIVIVFVVYLIRSGANYWVTFHGHMMGVDIQNDMQKDLFRHLLTLPYSYFDEHKSGVLTSRAVNDLQSVTELAHHGPENLIQTTGALIGSYVILCTINWKLATIVFAFFPLLIGFVWKLRVQMNEGYRRSRAAVSEINGELQNSLGGIRVSKAFNNDAGELKKLSVRTDEFREARKLSYTVMARFNTGMEFMLDMMYLIVLTAGGLFCFRGEISVGDFTAYFLYIANFLTPIRKLMAFSEMLEDGLAGFQRFCEIMDVPSEKERPDAVEVSDLKGDIVFDHVTFRYKGSIGQEVLKGLSVRIPDGKKVALVGPSGGGKTTMCHLIPRFYDVEEGTISIDGRDIETITRRSLRQHIGIVQQDVFLFTGSIADNIAYAAPDATPEEIREAARKARIDTFIDSLPEGYNTYVGERGVMLSGGQKQRIAIARIFLKDPQILILDEATSALDNVTEAELQQSLDELSHGRTTVVVAHRLSTVRDADEILYLTENGVEEHGTHEDLLALGGKYAALYRTQFS